MKGIIYKATNRKNNKVYIGQTITPLEKRMSGHKSNAKHNGHCRYFNNAIKKYNFDVFEWETICSIEASTDVLLAEYLEIAEQMWIDEFDATNREKGYNLKEAGLHGKLAEETKQLLREANSGENNGMYGKFRKNSSTWKGSNAKPSSIRRRKQRDAKRAGTFIPGHKFGSDHHNWKGDDAKPQSKRARKWKAAKRKSQGLRVGTA